MSQNMSYTDFLLQLLIRVVNAELFEGILWRGYVTKVKPQNQLAIIPSGSARNRKYREHR